MENAIEIYIDLQRVPTLAGTLWIHSKQGRQSVSFEYDRSWLKHPDRFALDPALQLVAGTFHASTEKPLFGAIEDSAPDRWGRILMRRAERRLARQENRHPHTLSEMDFLLRVDDRARLGALRFKKKGDSSFLTTYKKNSIPPLLSLGKLLSASNRVLQDNDTDEDLRLILAPGSSLGGARPKATICDDDGYLAIAKFPKQDDEIDIIGWEAVALTLAQKAHIATPKWRLQSIHTKRILISKRFDRIQNLRIPFLSAMSVLQARDNEPHSYLEIADALRQMSAQPKNDLRNLWRRIVFNILISNVDDHLRNHAFLYLNSSGWTLSPAFDLNPTPTDIRPRILSTCITVDDPTASMALAFDVGNYFDLELPEMRQIAKEVASATQSWKTVASHFKIAKKEIDRMASAFEHEDLKKI